MDIAEKGNLTLISRHNERENKKEKIGRGVNLKGGGKKHMSEINMKPSIGRRIRRIQKKGEKRKFFRVSQEPRISIQGKGNEEPARV